MDLCRIDDYYFSDNENFNTLGIKIKPSFLEAESIFTVSVWIKESENAESGFILNKNLDLIYLPDITYGYNMSKTPKGTNCSRSGGAIIKNSQEIDYQVDEIIVSWSDHHSYKSGAYRTIYKKYLSKYIDVADDGTIFSNPYLYVNINLDLKGDGKYVLENEYKFKLDH